MSRERADTIQLANRGDLLSQMLTSVRLRGVAAFLAELTSPWAFCVSDAPAHIYIVTEGELVLETGAGRMVHGLPGDVIMVPHATRHTVGDSPGRDAVASAPVLAEQLSADHLKLTYGGGGASTKVIVGLFEFEGRDVPALIASLPAVVHISHRDNKAAHWVEALAGLLADEAEAPQAGTPLAISRIVDVLTIRALRTWAASDAPDAFGWLSTQSQKTVVRALQAIHSAPAEPWSVDALAEIAGMSRSGFATRFKALTGQSPSRYLSHWRLSLAVDLLRRPEARVSDVARQVGYGSDAAFSRAFKAQFGYAPIAVRQT